MTDYSNCKNPYDFANPVSKKELFAGRASIREDIEYYLDQASKSPSPINLALLGDRASGKTSFLNLIDILSTEKSMLSVRINLDEGDVEDQFTFFSKLLESIIDVACKNGAFGGLSGKTYQTYLALNNTLSVPEDQTYLSFQFPTQRVHVVKSGNQNIVKVQDSLIQHDINLIHEEVGKAIVITMDECNVLQKNKIILQKIRNIFMNQPGFMLVIAATNELFPVLDDVFSPIIRQFKRISIEEYSKQEETKECILKPLIEAGISYKNLFKNGRLGDLLTDIHSLTHGKPYEIQLLCYAMFKRIQSKKTKHMALDIPVLEEVRVELRKESHGQGNAIVNSIEMLNKQELNALAVFTDCGKGISLEFLKNYEYILNGEKRITQKDFYSNFDKFKEMGILKENNNQFEYCGDSFDAIYSKYHAKKQGVLLGYFTHPYHMVAPQKLINIAFNKINSLNMLDDVHIYSIQISAEAETDENTSSKLISDIGDISENAISGDKDLFSIDEFDARKIFLLSAEAEAGASNKNVNDFLFTIQLEKHLISLEFYSNVVDADKIYNIFKDIFDPITKRSNERSFKSKLELHDVELPSIDLLITQLNKSENENIRSRIAHDCSYQLAELYINQKDVNKTNYYRKILESIDTDKTPSELNNLAYLNLKENNYAEAEKYFLQSIASYNKKYGEDYNYSEGIDDASLLFYNLACVYAVKGDLAKAKNALCKINDLIEPRAVDNQVGCLFEMTAIDSEIILSEIFNVDDLVDRVDKSIKLIESLMDQ